jgi:hypothetical protein
MYKPGVPGIIAHEEIAILTKPNSAAGAIVPFEAHDLLIK